MITILLSLDALYIYFEINYVILPRMSALAEMRPFLKEKQSP